MIDGLSRLGGPKCRTQIEHVDVGSSYTAPARLAVAYAVFDRNGRFVASSDNDTALTKLSLAEREYFGAMRNAGDGLIVAPPLAGQITGRMLVPVLKRLTTPAGEFDGVVLTALDPTRLVDVYRSIDLGADGFVGVALGDGRIVARSGAIAAAANGQGEMKGKLFRIAHIGYYDYLDTIGILAALEHVLASVTGKPVEYGAAVRAAQEVYAHSASEKRQPVGA